MDWAIKIGYAVMVFAIIMCFIFSKRGEKEMRHMVDRFAQAFCKLSNYVLPGGKAPAASLSTRKKDGVMQALPAAERQQLWVCTGRDLEDSTRQVVELQGRNDIVFVHQIISLLCHPRHLPAFVGLSISQFGA